MTKTDGLKTLQKFQDMENKRAFFDEFIRIEQKSRLHGRFPDMNNIIRLENYLRVYQETYGTCTESRDMARLIDTIVKRTLEYSISIDGGGRKEFVSAATGIKETNEEEETKDLLNKISEKLG